MKAKIIQKVQANRQKKIKIKQNFPQPFLTYKSVEQLRMEAADLLIFMGMYKDD